MKKLFVVLMLFCSCSNDIAGIEVYKGYNPYTKEPILVNTGLNFGKCEARFVGLHTSYLDVTCRDEKKMVNYVINLMEVDKVVIIGGQRSK